MEAIKTIGAGGASGAKFPNRPWGLVYVKAAIPSHWPIDPG
jgi:hypothetical protein